MSGGSMDYLYCKIEECIDDYEDPEIMDLARDFAKLTHDCEWYGSGDTSIGDYQESVKAFKAKWFCDISKREERLKKYIIDYADKVLGHGPSCEQCRHSTNHSRHDRKYYICDVNSGCVYNRYDYCEKFEKKN